jgi:hypothetical protein
MSDARQAAAKATVFRPDDETVKAVTSKRDVDGLRWRTASFAPENIDFRYVQARVRPGEHRGPLTTTKSYQYGFQRQQSRMMQCSRSMSTPSGLS